jgi:hypothetical protein
MDVPNIILNNKNTDIFNMKILLFSDIENSIVGADNYKNYGIGLSNIGLSPVVISDYCLSIGLTKNFQLSSSVESVTSVAELLTIIFGTDLRNLATLLSDELCLRRREPRPSIRIPSRAARSLRMRDTLLEITNIKFLHYTDKKEIKFSPYMRKFRRDRLQSHI